MQVPPHVSSFDPKQPAVSADQPESADPSRHSFAWLAFAMLLVVLLLGMVFRTEARYHLLPALVITLAFAIFARVLRGVTLSGAAAGFLVTLILFVANGVSMFGAVLLVFVLTFIATRFGRQRKRSLAIAERPAGRDAAQVLANVGCAALAAAASVLTPWHVVWLAGSIASLAEAASDTVSSEIGKAMAGTARLITSSQIVPAGTDGAISLPGTVAGVAAAAAVGLEAFATGMLSLRLAIAASISGILGMFLDSLLGATLERRRWLTNNGVNLLSTGTSVVAVILLANFF